ncbi:MAG: replicative DNA helicase [Phascolarctobacterium sp.]|nr:replicative DNA helicase [Phascolarctobacterium sp.]
MEEIREIPRSLEAEQGVLGAMLLGDQNAIDDVTTLLVPEDFYEQTHKEIYRHMLELHNAGKIIDTITLVNSLRSSGKLDAVGGLAYITTIAASIPTTANIEFHAKIIKDKSRLRRMIDTATNIVKRGYEPGTEDVQTLLDKAESEILSIAQESQTSDFVSISDIVQPSIDLISEAASRGGMMGIPTNIMDFDKMTGGLQPSDFIIIAARPSMGKTTLALNIAAEVALRSHRKMNRDKLTVAIFSLEMSKEQLVTRLLSAEAHIDGGRIRDGNLSDKQWSAVWEKGGLLSDSKIFIAEAGNLSSMELRTRARRCKAEHGLDLIIIDYLQLMKGSTRHGGDDSRQAEVSEISRSLKALAKELKIPIIALSQLSRAVESRTSKRPMLSDLRESGSLEQDADIVAFLYRDDYYNPECEHPGVTELIIAKHRNGSTGVVNLYFEKNFTRFRDMSKRPEE